MVMLGEQITESQARTPPRLHMTEEEFAAWCDEDTQAEWVEGEVIVASPANIAHVRLVKFMLRVMDAYVVQRGLGEVLGPEFQVRLSRLRRRRVPDLLFVSKERLSIIQATHVEGAPDLALEIVSPDSPARDWREKYWEYEAAGVREYWVIDPLAERVEAYTLGESQRYALIEEKDGAILSIALAGFYLKPAWLWQDPLPNPMDVLKELGAL